MPVVLHVSPHPDDEALGAPATLLLLRRSGWRVVNALASLGRPADHDRRRAEAVEANRRAGFELVLRNELPVDEWLGSLLREFGPAIVVSPSPDDAHPSHEAVARATEAACAAATDPPVWWQWGLWADLRRPTLYVPFDEDVLAEAQHVLAAYSGELARNDYARLLEARAVAHAVLGSERVFGFGSARASDAPYAELLSELRLIDGTWHHSPPRLLAQPVTLRSARPSSP
jgi:LmbE family N-acetylglucosaminyl deacetylase